MDFILNTNKYCRGKYISFCFHSEKYCFKTLKIENMLKYSRFY